MYDPSGYPENLILHTNVALARDPSRLLLSFKKPYSDLGFEQIRPLGLVPEYFQDASLSTCAGMLKPGEELNQSPASFWLRSADCSAISELSENQLESAFLAPLEWIGPVYSVVSIKQKGRRALLCPHPDVLLIKPIKNVDETTLFKKMASLGLSEVPTKSKYLRPYRYYQLKNPRQQTVYPLRDLLLKTENLIEDAYLSGRQMITANAALPRDQFWTSGAQWNMQRIEANRAWQSTTFSANKSPVAVWIIDEGVDLGLPGNPRPAADPHPDLDFWSYGRNMLDVEDATIDGRCPLSSEHGTLMAGIIGAKFDNDVDATNVAMGVAGLTPNRCKIVPLCWSPGRDYDVELPQAINYALDNGARVINVSAEWEDYSITRDLYDDLAKTGALVDAAAKGALLCFASGNSKTDGLTGPASLFQFVMPCGASIEEIIPGGDKDKRWSQSNYGEGLSVVAPGEAVMTTTNRTLPSQSTWYKTTTGTSIATAHVSALAGYLFSQYPALDAATVRNIIEQTADKVLPAYYTYSDKIDTWPGGTYKYPNGPWNKEVGYGRINVFKALDFADVMIRDCVRDTGIQPSKPPCTEHWNSPDIIVLPDNHTPSNSLFAAPPSNSLFAGTLSNVFKGQDNYVYVRVTNNGPNDARNVEVKVRIAPYIGLEFIYPDDWTSAATIVPTRMTLSPVVIPAGTGSNTHIAKFKIDATQVGALAVWHPCILAEVVAENDYAFKNANGLPGKVNVSQRNNLAQRNLTVLRLHIGAGKSTMRIPFIAGNRLNVDETLEVVITLDWDPRRFPVRLYLDEDAESFSRDGGMLPQFVPSIGPAMRRLHFSDRQGIQVEGGVLEQQQGRTFLTFTNQNLQLKVVKEPRRLYPFALETTFTSLLEPATPFTVHIAQKTATGTVVGGATIIYVPENPR